MSVIERLSEDLKKALKSGDKDTTSVIRMVKAAIKNKAIEKRGDLTDDEINIILTSLAKQRRESIEQFAKGGRQDLVDKESKELLIIQSYLPPQLTEEELNKIIEDAIKEAGTRSEKDMGRIMKIIMPQIKGRADGKLVNELVKKILEG